MKTINDMIETFDELVERVRKLPAMTKDERNEQRASFAFGQMACMSRYENASPEELTKLRMLCRELAGCKPYRRDRPERAAAIKELLAALQSARSASAIVLFGCRTSASNGASTSNG